MGKKTVLLLIVALVALAIVPAVASAGLVNDYGMHFAGKSKCLECHSIEQDATVHGRMARSGIFPAAPTEWTMFRAAGDPTPVAGTSPAIWKSGGSYSILGQPWITLGDDTVGLATEYLFWRGAVALPGGGNDLTIMPWNLVEGLVYEHGEWMIGESPSGLYDVNYSCQRCHQLGTTQKATKGEVVPNPAATIQPTATTAVQWARDDTKTADDFVTDPTVSLPGMSIQCEACHGTGQAAGSAFADRHWNSGTQLSHRMPGNDFRTLTHSQVCGQCHGSYTAATTADAKTTLGVYGYTPNLPFRLFGDVNGLSGGASYTYIPTEEEFLAAPTKYFMFPNGSNAKGNHYYYNEWSASEHSWRGALQPTDPDASAFQAKGTAHYNSLTQSNIDSKCYKCHTGEGYLQSKGVGIAQDLVPTKDNTGFLGQECSTCHGGHPASLDEEDVVRAPDKAGVRSAAGLTMDNQSICEDCHNWQYEVQGTTPVYRPEAAGARVGPSHPQREMLHGKAMIDVPVAGEFMPGVTCEECHMPKTNKNANRYSHGMKIMEPGDAQTWNTAAGTSYMGEDSCSTCHPAQTRTELQDTLEMWQQHSETAATTAYAAINAAKTRAEFDPANSSNPGYILVGRATWNYKAWQNDLSGGVHNPEYTVGALDKAEMMAKSVGGSIVLDAPASVLPGVNTFVSGKAMNGDGTPAAGAVLKLWANGAAYGGGSPSVSTVTAAANGTFAFMVTQTAETAYQVQWLRSGDARTYLTSATVTVAKALYASKTTIKKSASEIKLGKSVTISGTVTSDVPATGTVKLQRRKGSGSWKSTTITLDASGNYKKKYTPGSTGTWYYKTTYNGSADVSTSKSGEVKVKVK
jgi:formate-dependent nitrite reductase cytochrome c552 subunit